LAGEIDLAFVPELERAITREIRRGHRHLVIDLSTTTFLDCASIGALLRAVAPLRRQPDSAVVLAGPTGIVKRLLDLLHLERLFDILPDLTNAGDHVTAGCGHRDGWRYANHKAFADGRGATIAEPKTAHESCSTRT
jgi:anti-anti-sigma factor